MTAAVTDHPAAHEGAHRPSAGSGRSAPSTRSARPARPTLRVVVRPAPPREPPYDDEIDAPAVATVHDRWLPFETAPPPAQRTARPLRPRGLPDPQPWARRLLIGLIETADGRRPLHQLGALLSPSVHRGLASDFERVGAARTTHWLRGTTVNTVRASEPAEGVAELCATIQAGGRVRAVALRLEQHHGRWVCTRLQLG